MTVTLVVPDKIYDQLVEKSNLLVESAGVLLAMRCETSMGDVRLLAREICWVDSSAYLRQTSSDMSITPQGYIEALAKAESQNAVPIWFHTHPGKYSVPLQSDADKRVDSEISDLFQLRSGTDYYGTLITSPRDGHIAFSGSIQYRTNEPVAIDKLWVVGNRWKMLSAFNRSNGDVGLMYTRNVRAFGPEIQRVIGMLQVAIVGAGGTGSAVAEQLVRLGVRRLVLVDSDKLSSSNVTRVYGSTLDDVGTLKVDVLCKHLRRIAPDLQCTSIASMVTAEAVGRELSGCDLIFGCTDDNAGRLVLSRLSTYFLIPVIDLGVLLSSNGKEELEGIYGRITLMYPGSACLMCRNRIDLARASAEMKTPEERKRLADEGYAPALGEVEPAVVSFTTIVAASAVSEFLERLIGFGAENRTSEVLLRIHDREISTNHVEPRIGHYCHPSTGKLGLGYTEPFLEQVWS